jgi:transposase
VDERGVPLSIVVSGANRHDVTQLQRVLDGIVIERPRPAARRAQHLCADKAYPGKPARQTMLDRHYVPHVKQRGEEVAAKRRRRGFRARRWVVEACHSSFNRFRKILVRYEKKTSNYVALLHLAAAVMCLRKIGIIYG